MNIGYHKYHKNNNNLYKFIKFNLNILFIKFYNVKMMCCKNIYSKITSMLLVCDCDDWVGDTWKNF